MLKIKSIYYTKDKFKLIDIKSLRRRFLRMIYSKSTKGLYFHEIADRQLKYLIEQYYQTTSLILKESYLNNAWEILCLARSVDEWINCYSKMKFKLVNEDNEEN